MARQSYVEDESMLRLQAHTSFTYGLFPFDQKPCQNISMNRVACKMIGAMNREPMVKQALEAKSDTITFFEAQL